MEAADAFKVAAGSAAIVLAVLAGDASCASEEVSGPRTATAAAVNVSPLDGASIDAALDGAVSMEGAPELQKAGRRQINHNTQQCTHIPNN